MTNHYEINVSQNGKHLFATAERSLPATEPEKMELLLKSFNTKFPEKEGYKISVTLWKCEGHII